MAGPGPTPESDSFRPKPDLPNSSTLTVAEQLTLDYLDDPAAFVEVVSFHDQHVGQIEALRTELDAVIAAKSVYAQKGADYRQLLVGHEATELVLHGASQAVLETRHEVRGRSDSLASSQQTFSSTMATYFREHLPDRPHVTINGIRYGSWGNSVATTRPEGKRERVTLFTHGPAVAHFISLNYVGANAEAGRIREGGQYARVATDQDWQALLDGLKLVAHSGAEPAT